MNRIFTLIASLVLNAIFLIMYLFPEPVMHTPRLYGDMTGTALFIRGTRWSLLVGTKDEELDRESSYGQTDCPNYTIFIRGDLNYENQRDTIFHEALHAGTCDTKGYLHNTYYNSPNALTHEGIYKISQFTTELLSSNPELARYLAGR